MRRIWIALFLGLATTGPVLADPIYDEFVINGGTHNGFPPGKWGANGFGTPGGVVTWSIIPAGTPVVAEAGNFGNINAVLPAGFLADIQAAFNAWQAVANIQFQQVSDDGAPGGSPGAPGLRGDIRIGVHPISGVNGGVLAHAYYPEDAAGGFAGDVHFDSLDTWRLHGSAGSGFDVFIVALHEIGHSIGLDHQNPPPNAVMNPFYNASLTGLLTDDILGAQAIYGPAVTSGPGGIVPEPSSWVAFVLMLGVIGVVGFRRMRAAPVAC